MTGWQQSPKMIRVPSSLDIATVGGRICRYAGNIPCTLITHLMIGARVVWRLVNAVGKPTDRDRIETFAWWMLHDAHEVITGDFIFTKSEEMDVWQREIDDAISCTYGIDFKYVDVELIHGADLLCRWLEVKHYGSAAHMKTYEEHYAYDIPSPAMVQETQRIFESEFGRMSSCVVDDNRDGRSVHIPVLVYARILEAILLGNQDGAVKIYMDDVVDLEH